MKLRIARHPSHFHSALTLARFTVCATYLVAVVSKLVDFDSLLSAISRLGWVPDPFVAATSKAILILEACVVFMLLTRRTSTVGAIIGATLSAAFAMTTISLLMRGTSEQCACFGVFIKLPPVIMLGVDAVLFTCCLVIMTVARNTTSASQIARTDSNGGSLEVRRRFVTAASLAYVLSMALLLQVGFERERLRADQIDNQVVNLRYGDPAPDFSAITKAGTTIGIRDLTGKPTLICFIRQLCEPCDDEAMELAANCEKWKEKLSVLLVLVGRPLLKTPQEACREYSNAYRMPQQVSVVCDPTGEMARKYCDFPLATPFSVLLDKGANVRFIQSGRESGEFSLVRDIEAFISETPYRAADAYRRTPWYGREAPDAFVMVKGKRSRVSEFWKPKPVLLVFALRNCASCKEFRTFVERLMGNDTSTEVLYIYPTREDAIEERRNTSIKGQIASDDTGMLHTAYQVWNAPSVFLIEDGRILYTSGPRSSTRDLQSLVESRRTKTVRNKT